MLHLAQVLKQGSLGCLELRLLAFQKPDTTWAVITEEVVVSLPAASPEREGNLVLVELSQERQVIGLAAATEWVLDLVQKYLAYPYTPAFLQQEAERAEQWRQSLTLESQELGRRTLELEARREQIEALEANLKQERQQLEIMAAQLRMESQSEE